MTDFLDTPLTPAECKLISEHAPHLVATTIDGDIVPACGVNRRTVVALQTRFNSMGPQPAPVKTGNAGQDALAARYPSMFRPKRP